MSENYGKCEITVKFNCVSCNQEIRMIMNPNSLASTILETGEIDPPSTGLHLYCNKCGGRNYFRFD